MKLNFKTMAFLALASIGFSSAAQAATTLYTQGDLLLGFHDSSNSYVINLGTITKFTGLSAGLYTLSSTGGAGQIQVTGLAGVSADLSSTGLFGSGWATNSAVSWGIAGFNLLSGSGPTQVNDIWMSKAETTVGTQSTTWAARKNTNQATTGNVINAAGSGYTANTSTTNNPLGLITTNSATNSWASFQPDGATRFNSFSAYSPTAEAVGITGTALDLFSLVGNSGNTGGASYVGSFQITSTGDIQFATSAPLLVAAVPEPSKAVLFGFGLAALVLRRRRA
jgi:hypothetical protein